MFRHTHFPRINLNKAFYSLAALVAALVAARSTALVAALGAVLATLFVMFMTPIMAQTGDYKPPYKPSYKLNAPDRAAQDWTLQCQGCHGAHGELTKQEMPVLQNHVAIFLDIPGGREYLTQVPGVANVDLSDTRLANLLNWVIVEFDPEGVRGGFKPYTPAEVDTLRKQHLVKGPVASRAQLLKNTK